MKIVYDQKSLEQFTREAIFASQGHPVLIDKFLEDAVEIDVDAVSDKKTTVVAGIMEHIEEAGVHSGDSACVLPPKSLSKEILDNIIRATKALAKELEVQGLMNIQYAIKDNKLFVLEVNPRASRTIPFVSKATGVPWAKVATKTMLGMSLADMNIEAKVKKGHVAVKEAVFPFDRFPGVDTLLGPEMKSTGEVMGIDDNFGTAFAKAQLAAGQNLPVKGTIFFSVRDADKEKMLNPMRLLHELGFNILATSGTSDFLKVNGIDNKKIPKVSEARRPNVVDAIKNREVDMIINTGAGERATRDGYKIRRAALRFGVPYATTAAGALAMCSGIGALKKKNLEVCCLQDYYKRQSEKKNV